MPFPFLAPLKPEIVKILKERQALDLPNKLKRNLLSPFVILSSAAVVQKHNPADGKNAVRTMIEKNAWSSGKYKGCVVANTTDISKMYQLGKTLVGYDLDGKPIEVDGETGRRVSLPLIIKMDLDTDGGNNTLKTAKLEIKVFTLKQLEMFELFFLRPSMSVVLEWGWNVEIRDEKYTIDKKLFASKNHEDYLKQYIEIYSKTEDAYKKAKVKYIAGLLETKGCYDFMAGKVVNFTYSPDADGTYNITLDISAGNELQLWTPLKQSTEKATTAGRKNEETGKPDDFQTWINKIAADLNNTKLARPYYGLTKSRWEKDFFNWNIVNKKQEDTKFSKDRYISFKLILEILNFNPSFSIAPKKIGYAYYLNKGNSHPIIPVTSHPNIISTTTEFILPGSIPKIIIPEAEKKNVIKMAGKWDAATSTYTAETTDVPINKDKRFAISTDTKNTSISIYDINDNEVKVPSASTGNLLNVFFNYDTFVRAYQSSYTEADIITSLLQTFNDNMFGLCKLEIQKMDDSEDGSPLSIIDTKIPVLKDIVTKPADIYRFKIGAMESNVRNFEFNMELSTLMQAQSLYSTQLALKSALEKSANPAEIDYAAPEMDKYQSADLSYSPNSDGYYSVNAIETLLVKDASAWNEKLQSMVDVDATKKGEDKDKEKTAAAALKELKESLESKWTKFKLNPNDKNSPVYSLIYNDARLVQRYINIKREETTALTFLEITIVIDGLAGFSCGEYFHIDGVPEVYNINGYFQITNVKQAIAENGWTTTIEAGYRINTN
jgi:hypothetical protein